jgi:hypothetical protein
MGLPSTSGEDAAQENVTVEAGATVVVSAESVRRDTLMAEL